MPRAATSSSLSPGILSQCKPFKVADSEITREIGNEFEFPNTLMAVIKLEARLLNRKSLATTLATSHDTNVWTTKIAGIMARSESFLALSWDASFVKTRDKNC